MCAFFQFILGMAWITYEPLTKGDYVYPHWSDSLGWIMAMVAILSVPVIALYQIGEKMLVGNADIDSIPLVRIATGLNVTILGIF
jgi:hypothetical protein